MWTTHMYISFNFYNLFQFRTEGFDPLCHYLEANVNAKQASI